MTATPHISVLRDAVVTGLAPRDGGVYVDGTFGAGGYSRALLQCCACSVIGIDRDPLAATHAAALSADFPGRVRLLPGCFGDMDQLLGDAGIGLVDGITLDLGVSSMQIDDPDRGFSFQKDGPLDMRMSQDGPSAADLVNSLSEEELADIFWRLGEERHSRRIARAIAADRTATPFTTTAQLAGLIRRIVPRSRDGIDPATRSFQGLRLAVNDELGEVERGLRAAEQRLASGGRLAVVTFHSLEDRIVKEFLKNAAGDIPQPSRHMPAPTATHSPTFRLLSRKAIAPEDAEIAANPRARSAKLRLAERSDAPARPADGGQSAASAGKRKGGRR